MGWASGLKHFLMRGRSEGRIGRTHPEPPPSPATETIRAEEQSQVDVGHSTPLTRELVTSSPPQMNKAEKVHIIFGAHGNCEMFAGDGWSRAEASWRWSTGTSSTIKLPPLSFKGDVLMSFIAAPFYRKETSIVPALSILINDKLIDELILNRGASTYSVLVPGELFSNSKDNIMTFRHPNPGSPSAFGEQDTRQLAIAMEELSLEPSNIRLFAKPRLLPHAPDHTLDPESLNNLAFRFQSLGQNGEFGLFQRRCGAEPLGLLRFSSITLTHLLKGITTGFSGIGDPDKLTFTAKNLGKELFWNQKIYGLGYHTFKNDGDVDFDKLTASEAVRLNYLARMLIEQITEGEKIFVVQRSRPTLMLLEVLSLLRCLRAYNPDVTLLWVVAASAEEGDLVGRVEVLGPNFYKGYLERLAPGENAHDLLFDEWLGVCRSVVETISSGLLVEALPERIGD